jgi:predicted transcriptional regulator
MIASRGEEREMATVRVAPKVHATLRELAAAEQRSIGQVIADAVDRYQKETFWRAMREGFARLRADPAAWGEYQDEAALWDSASGDGVEDEEPYFTAAEARDEVAATTTPG